MVSVSASRLVTARPGLGDLAGSQPQAGGVDDLLDAPAPGGAPRRGQDPVPLGVGQEHHRLADAEDKGSHAHARPVVPAPHGALGQAQGADGRDRQGQGAHYIRRKRKKRSFEN